MKRPALPASLLALQPPEVRAALAAKPSRRRKAADPAGRRGWEAVVDSCAVVVPRVRYEIDAAGYVRALVATLPGLRVVNASNGSHGHWSATAKRRKRERAKVLAALIGATIPMRADGQRWAVTFTREGVRMMDDDNLAVAFKACRDAVGAALGCGDAPAAPVAWRYAQRRAKAYAVEVRVETCASGTAAVSLSP